jgi:glycosyltransferase involved in cell wall biosynthesis
MKLPLVSIIMPTMNSEKFIRETLHSLIAQKYKRFELIVVDGASKDKTLDIVESYSDGDIKIIELALGLGIAAALNAGIDAAKGEFIARMDADDIAYEWRLHDQVQFLIRNPQISLVGTGVDAFWDKEGVYRSPISHTNIKNEFLVNNPFFHPTIMFRRSIAESGLYRYNETYSFEEDYELWGRLITKIECHNLNQSSIKYRINGNSSQWDPRKFEYKMRALNGFCSALNINNQDFVSALAEFQCSGFIRAKQYEILREYALEADGEIKPKLGWLQESLVRESNYADFFKWFRQTKGW